MRHLLRENIFQIRSQAEFDLWAMELFAWQYAHNDVYRMWCQHCKRTPANVSQIADIPFLPISFFKTHRVISFTEEPAGYFQSSGTTQQFPAKHYIKDYGVYEESFNASFRLFFGDPADYTFIAILPNYEMQGHSSLIYMMQHLIAQSNSSESGFYPEPSLSLAKQIKRLHGNGHKLIVFGVSYALLELLSIDSFALDHAIIFETGGMKGMRKEMIREELHAVLKRGFGVRAIASEYGMCELFSQAYAKENGIFCTPPHMQIRLRDINDPFSWAKTGKTGGINVIDLANIHSCSFIATQDLGRMHPSGGFELLGRFDHSEARGCNLLFAEQQWLNP